MIHLDILPCADCRFYSGIKQQNKSELNEHVSCNKAKTKNAKELLQFSNGAYLCEKYEEIGAE